MPSMSWTRRWSSSESTSTGTLSKQVNHILTPVKKLKSLDLPDLIGAIKAKKLPKEALRSVLPRFKLGEGDKIELVEPVEELKTNANKDFEEYLSKNESFLQELKKFESFI